MYRYVSWYNYHGNYCKSNFARKSELRKFYSHAVMSCCVIGNFHGSNPTVKTMKYCLQNKSSLTVVSHCMNHCMFMYTKHESLGACRG